MKKEDLLKILMRVKDGLIEPDEALKDLGSPALINLDFARLDLYRSSRNELSEVIYGSGKTTEQILQIVDALADKKHNIFGTYFSKEVGALLQNKFPNSSYDEVSKTFSYVLTPTKIKKGSLAILCAGTSDIPVAEEARLTAKFFGVEAQKFYDVGVACLHRTLDCLDEIKKADAVIVIAGMEGALPSVIGGLIPKPIIAVPTSIGYGTNLNGFTPLFAMLNSCSEGIVVVNINNGFGAACAALRMMKNSDI